MFNSVSIYVAFTDSYMCSQQTSGILVYRFIFPRHIPRFCGKQNGMGGCTASIAFFTRYKQHQLIVHQSQPAKQMLPCLKKQQHRKSTSLHWSTPSLHDFRLQQPVLGLAAIHQRCAEGWIWGLTSSRHYLPQPKIRYRPYPRRNYRQWNRSIGRCPQLVRPYRISSVLVRQWRPNCRKEVRIFKIFSWASLNFIRYRYNYCG